MFRRDAISVMYFATVAGILNAAYHLFSKGLKDMTLVGAFNLVWAVMLFMAIVFTHLHIRNEFSTRSYTGFSPEKSFEEAVSNAEDVNATDNDASLKIWVLIFWGLVVGVPFMTLYEKASDTEDNAQAPQSGGVKPASMWKSA